MSAMAGRKDKDVCQSSTEWEEEVKRKSSLRYHSYPLHSCFYSNRYRYYFPYTDRKL